MKENEDLSLDKTIKYSAIIKDHLFNEISITDSYLRMGSDSWCELVNFYRENKDTENSKSEIGWGHQIRSYVLQPYRLVKDNRTNFESTSPDKVLDGELDGFLEQSLYQIK